MLISTEPSVPRKMPMPSEAFAAPPFSQCVSGMVLLLAVTFTPSLTMAAAGWFWPPVRPQHSHSSAFKVFKGECIQYMYR